MPQRRPVGPAGRGPRRKYHYADFEQWSYAQCGRVLPERMIEEIKNGQGTEEPPSAGTSERPDGA